MAHTTLLHYYFTPFKLWNIKAEILFSPRNSFIQNSRISMTEEYITNKLFILVTNILFSNFSSFNKVRLDNTQSYKNVQPRQMRSRFLCIYNRRLQVYDNNNTSEGAGIQLNNIKPSQGVQSQRLG